MASRRAGADLENIANVHQGVGANVVRVLPGTSVREVRLPPAMSVEQAVARYERSPAVRFAEPDYRLQPSQGEQLHPNDPGYPSLYGLHNTGQDGGTPDADIDAPQAWALTTGSAQVVAVIDTGVAVSHPDLVDNVWTNFGEIAGNNVGRLIGGGVVGPGMCLRE